MKRPSLAEGAAFVVGAAAITVALGVAVGVLSGLAALSVRRDSRRAS